jgi:galactonate dehydratase
MRFDMIITDIECKIMNISKYSNWVFIFIQTDVGMVGLGEASIDGKELEVQDYIHNIKKHYIGQDLIKNQLHELILPMNMAEAAALSGIDIALWDLKGKFYQKPIYELLGNTFQTNLKMYATFNRSLKERTIEEFVRVSKGLVERGFLGIKCAPFDNVHWQSINDLSHTHLNMGIKRVEAIRDAIGSHIELRVDNHWRFDYKGAVTVAKTLEPLDLYWFEAPVSEKSGAEVARVRNSINQPIAGAEMQWNMDQIGTLFEHDALDIYMFDIKYIGGISGIIRANSEVLKINRKIAPHNMTGPVSTAASMHVCASFSNFDSLEFHLEETTYIEHLSNLKLKLSDGKVRVPKGSGLGIELDMNVIDQHPYQPTIAFRPNMLGDQQ